MIYLISDSHFWHRNIILYERSHVFENLEQMHKCIVGNWRKTVKEEDTIYHLGDVFLCGFKWAEFTAKNLTGRKILIKGNHDNFTNTQYQRLGFAELHKTPIILDDKFILTHAPIPNEVMNSEYSNYINIHGHLHGKSYPETFDPKYHYNVSVENIGYTPISLDELHRLFDE